MSDILATLLGIAIFVVVIALSIGLHEFGHFATAKRFGVKVTEFMIGFGPKIWGKSKGETTYGLKAIPVGGYVRIVGMYPPSPAVTRPASDPDSPHADEAASADSGGPFASLIADARAQSMAEITPGDEDRVFYRLSIPRRMAVMLAGPGMNLVLAFVLFAIVLVGVGLPTTQTTVREVVPCVPSPTSPLGEPIGGGGCAADSEPSPAVDADIAPGDNIVGVDGTPVDTWDELTGELEGLQVGSTAVFDVERGERVFSTVAVVALARYPIVDADGAQTGEIEERPFLGIRPDSSFEPLPLSAVPGFMWDITVSSVEALISLPARLWDLTVTMFTGGERDIDGPVSVVGVSRLGGEIAAAEQPLMAKVGTFLALAASLNLFLFLFNLIPLLPLDGGHVAAAGYEGVRRRIAEARGRPDPGPVDTVRMLPVTYAVASVLLISGLIVIWADLVKPITLGT